MLIRQRALLHLVQRIKHPLSSTMLFKLAFLLREETSLVEDSTFYDFLPYKFGPYSFAMHREIEALVSYGYLMSQAATAGARFVRGETPSSEILPLSISAAIDAIVSRYAGVPQRDLLRDVYARYPWYATNTELRELLTTPLPPRADAKLAIYTIGYHRSSVDAFANRLLREGVRSVIDVRANPVSRKYCFAGSSLKLISRKVGLEYRHFPGLGIPSSMRRGVSGQSGYNDLFSDYEKHTLTRETGDIAAVAALIKSRPSVLLCAEQNADDCHRSRLAVVVGKSTGLPTINF